MANWLARPLIVFASACLIGGLGALLHRIFAGVGGEWLIFGGLSLFSAFVFLIVEKLLTSTGAQCIQHHKKTLAPGEYWDISVKNWEARVELIEIEHEDDAIIAVTASRLLFHGENVKRLGPLSNRYVLPKMALDGKDGLFYWGLGSSNFYFVCLCLDQISKERVSVRLAFVRA